MFHQFESTVGDFPWGFRKLEIGLEYCRPNSGELPKLAFSPASYSATWSNAATEEASTELGESSEVVTTVCRSCILDPVLHHFVQIVADVGEQGDG